MPQYAHPSPAPLPNRKRCRILHSPAIPARCRLPRGHDGDCAFGWWRGGTHTVNLDALPKVVTQRSTDGGG